MKMYVKKLKRICDVKGCKNVETFAIGRYKQLGGGPVICKQCLEDALKEAKNPDITDRADAKAVKIMSSSLFPRGIADVPPVEVKADDGKTVESGEESEISVETSAEKSNEDKQADDENKSYVCPNCGKKFKTEQGLNNHLKNCIKK